MYGEVSSFPRTFDRCNSDRQKNEEWVDVICCFSHEARKGRHSLHLRYFRRSKIGPKNRDSSRVSVKLPNIEAECPFVSLTLGQCEFWVNEPEIKLSIQHMKRFQSSSSSYLNTEWHGNRFRNKGSFRKKYLVQV